LFFFFIGHEFFVSSSFFVIPLFYLSLSSATAIFSLLIMLLSHLDACNNIG
jgi:hypothetical protein